MRSQYGTNLDDKTASEIVKWNHDNDASTANIAKVIAGGDIASPQAQSNDYYVSQNTTGIITIYFSEAIKQSSLNINTFEVAGFTITGITAPEGTKRVIL